MAIFSRKEKKEESKDSKAVVAKPARKKATARPRLDSARIHSPLLTEKAANYGEKNTYVFLVDKKSNKPEIRKEVEKLFGVNVTSVRVVNQKSKNRMWRGQKGKKSSNKKAFVTVQSGEKIEVLPT